MKDRQGRPVSWLGLLVMAGMTAMLFVLAQSGKPQFGKPHSVNGALEAIPPTFTLVQSGKPQFGEPDSISAMLEALPPTAAGKPSSLALTDAQRPEVDLGGTLATGRIGAVYVRVADNTFLPPDRAPESLRSSAERWVEVQFPELLANDTGSARAILDRSQAWPQVGDVVEIKFAQKDNPHYFPVRELTHVTELVARKEQMLARDFERRILARSSHGDVRAQWLSQVPAAGPATGLSVQTTAADARR